MTVCIEKVWQGLGGMASGRYAPRSMPLKERALTANQGLSALLQWLPVHIHAFMQDADNQDKFWLGPVEDDMTLV